MDGVKRFTTEYVVPEDRIRLSLETNDGAVRVFWLTRRLTTRLVPEMVKVLETRAKVFGGQQAAIAPPTGNDHRRSQIDALGQLEEQDPVRAGDGVEEHLVGSLSMRLKRNGILLDLKAGEDVLLQTLPFPESAFRQWLVMLNLAYRKASWGDDIWPDWISLRGGEGGPDPVRLN